MREPPIPLVDLKPQQHSLGGALEAAIGRVLDHGQFVGGPEVREFENAFARFSGAAHAIGVGSGTDALIFALAGLGIGPGDEVVTVAHTFAATLDAILHVGATPLLVDVEPTSQCIDPAALGALLAARVRRGDAGAIKAVIAVHLFGRPAPIDAIRDALGELPVALVEDAAQAHGAHLGTRGAGSLGQVAAFSFYPSKNLGAMGDAGAVLTSDAALAERVRALADHGRAPGEKYLHRVSGRNSRLDTIQAAMLLVKLTRLADWNRERRRYAALYRELLAGLDGLALPSDPPGGEHVYHLFVVTTPHRDELATHLAARAISTAVHYPIPCHLQLAYRRHGAGEGSLPVTEQLARENLSLPLYPGMGEERVQRVADAVRDFFAAPAARP